MKVYDMENHFYPKELFEYLKTRTDYPYYNANTKCIDYGNGAVLGAEAPAFNPPINVCDEAMDLDEYRIGRMDYAGVDVAVLSAACIAELLPREDAIKYARVCNDAVAEAIKKHPDRFMGTICLPTPYVDDAVKELERAVKDLGLSYWHTHSNYGNHYLYEDMFDPILDKCAELDVPFYIHPQNPTTDYLLDSGITFASAGFGFAVDVMKTSMRLIMKGLFDKHPNLIMILGHMAEFYPFILGRIDNRFTVGKDFGDPEIKCNETFTHYFQNKNIFMTTSGIFDPGDIALAIKNIGVDNIMLGSDFPYENFKECVDFIKDLSMPDDYKERILYKNAEKYILKVK